MASPLQVWRFDASGSAHGVVLEEEIGVFKSDQAYVILSTVTDAAQSKLYLWVGDAASKETKVAAAKHAAELTKTCEAAFLRQQEGTEHAEFKQLFPKFTVVPAPAAAGAEGAAATPASPRQQPASPKDGSSSGPAASPKAAGSAASPASSPKPAVAATAVAAPAEPASPTAANAPVSPRSPTSPAAAKVGSPPAARRGSPTASKKKKKGKGKTVPAAAAAPPASPKKSSPAGAAAEAENKPADGSRPSPATVEAEEEAEAENKAPAAADAPAAKPSSPATQAEAPQAAAQEDAPKQAQVQELAKRLSGSLADPVHERQKNGASSGGSTKTYLSEAAKAWGGNPSAAQQGAPAAAQVEIKPGEKTFSYEELKDLRAESGIDMTRKEEYLSDADFAKVFGKERGEFMKQPAWRKQLAKKEVGLW